MLLADHGSTRTFELRWLQWANEEYGASYDVDAYTADETVSRSEYEDLQAEKSALEERVDELESGKGAPEDRVEELQQRLDETTASETDTPSTDTDDGTDPTDSNTSAQDTPSAGSPGFGIETAAASGLGYLLYKANPFSDSED